MAEGRIQLGEAAAPPLGRGLQRTVLWCALSATLLWLAFPPIGLWPLAFLAPVPLAAVALPVEAQRGRRRALLYAALWLMACVKWLALNWWLVQVTPVGFAALCVYAGLFDVLMVWVLVRGRRALGVRVPWAVLLPVALASTESLRALVAFDGYPWFRAGHPLAEFPVLVQVCDLGGEVLASLLTASIAGAVLDLIAARSAAAGGRRGLGVVVALGCLLATFVYGAYRLGEAPQGPGPGVLAIQTNVPTSNKVRPTPPQQLRDGAAFAELTLEAALDTTRAGKVIALVAWPETSLGGYGLEPESLQVLEAGGYYPGTRFQRLAVHMSTQVGAPLLVGSPAFLGLRLDGTHWKWDHQYNSAYLVDSQPPPYPRYDKIFLAPFGETMPYIRAWPGLQQTLLSLGAEGMQFDLEFGAHPVQFQVPWKRPDGATQVVRVAAPICFEDAMGWVCRDLVFSAGPNGRLRCADLLVNLSNDGWFGWFDGGRAQHVQIARFRCIETRTPMVRVANTGICVGIDSSGRIAAEPPAPRSAAWLYANSPLDDRTPLYACIGDAVSWAVMALAAGLCCASFVRSGGRAPASALVAAVAYFAVGCSDQQAANQQPWSSRDQSVQHDGDARLANPNGPGVPSIPVSSSGAARQTAATLLQDATKSTIPVFRANAVEGLIQAPDDLRVVARPMLADPNRGVRFVACIAVGRTGLAEFADAVQPLLVDDSPSVRAAAIYAMTKFGQPVDPTPLAAMTLSDDPEIRSNAYMVLGDLGNPSAIPIIRASLGKGMRRVNQARVRIAELQGAESMVKLGDMTQIEPIRAALFDLGGGSEITALAAQIAGRLHDEGSRPLLIRLIDATGESARPTEIRLTAAASLAEFGPQDHPQVARLAKAYLRDRDPVVRGQAALALGRSEGPAAASDLERMLFDPDASVQLAAAKSLLIATRPR